MFRPSALALLLPRLISLATLLARLQPGALLAGALSLIVGGCAVGPVYQAPLSTLPAEWQARMPQGKTDPRPTVADWWARFDDPAVATLVHWAEADSPTLDKAAAAIASARAALVTSEAAALPTLDGSASVTRSRQAATGAPFTATQRGATLDAAWELDLFGKARRGREAAAARIEARDADWQASRISLAAEVADDYVQYRACRLLVDAYARQLTSLRDTARITEVAIRAGLGAPADADLAEAGAASGNDTLIAQETACELLVKALVALTGVTEPVLRATLDTPRDTLPVPAFFTVTSVPAALLRQRPDIASAERTLAVASADIGAAEAARWPGLSLGGSIGISASNGISPLSAWSIGPALVLPILDGGTRRAAVASARAACDAADADYRSSVRSAVQDVENALVQLYGAARRSDDAGRAAERYRRYVGATELNWRAGGTTLLSLEEARRSSIAAETTLLALRRDRLRQYIALYKALGGGWEAETAVSSTSTSTFISPSASGAPR